MTKAGFSGIIVMNKRVRKKLGMYGNENPRGNGGFFLLKKELTAAGVSGII